MDDNKKTLWFAGAAVVLAIIAIIAAPRRITPQVFLDQGQAFFPKFTDPNEATTLEVVGYNDQTGQAEPFKVTFENGRWTIPSHHDYPADAKDRLAKTAAGIIGIKKDDFRTDDVADHEKCGVIDPLDDAALGLTGRGKRVTLKGKNDNVLADIIIGNAVPDRPGFHFVRVPGQKRVYASRVDVDLSTKFQDWINTDLLEVEKDKIDKVILKDYSINERTYRIDQRDNLILTREGAKWKADNMRSNQQIDSTKMKDLLTAIDELSIVGVRPKPEGLSQNLKQSDKGMQMSQGDQLSLQSKGFYLTREGDLKSNEGELQVHTSEGVVYTLRFGEVLSGSDEGEADEGGASENRYLFITTSFDKSLFPEPPKPQNTDFMGKADSLLTDADREQKRIFDKHDAWQRNVDQGRKKSEDLNARFADWYYVISAKSFDKLNLGRKDLVVKREKTT
jgi:hypothetical protein